MKQFIFIYFLLICFSAPAQNEKNGRVITDMNMNWSFTKADAANATNIKWETINLPHTWNIADVMDDEPGYYRGACWYKKNFTVTDDFKNKEVYLFFEAANQQTDIFINGQKAGSHTGGYTGFYVYISPFLKYSADNSNEITVKVNNAFDQNIPPLTADFTFYGGIYRNVSMIAVNKIHFACDDHGANGIYISTPSVTKENASVTINGIISNDNTSAQKINITTTILNEEGTVVAKLNSQEDIKSGMDQKFTQELKPVMQPHLWSPDDPYLYTVNTQITASESGKELDALTNKTGFRFFHFDAAKGFFLNGNAYKLVGVSRHQDHEGMGNALPKQLAADDISLLKNMGGNFLRVAHYPQDQALLNACDEMGILASVEIPVVNEITESDTFYNNCRNMQLEMIHQNYNHPSVIIWGYMNEILLKPHFKADKKRQSIYYANIAKLARSLDSLSRKEDPYRYTMMANHGDFDPYYNTGLINIPMLVGWNLYMGWYGTTITDLPVFLDHYHELFPERPMMLTEYGADADTRIRSLQPVRFDKSMEYATFFHQYYFSEMMKRPFVAGAIVWNLADFNSETRQETMPHMNNKGLLAWNREPKEQYYFYQSMLSKNPFVKITSASWNKRVNVADSGTGYCMQPVKVASNLGYIQLKLNDKIVGSKKVENGFAQWTVPFTNGLNKISAEGSAGIKEFNDTATIALQIQPYNLKDKKNIFTGINILLGTNRFFNSKQGDLWMPDKVYREGSWGHVGGKAFRLPNSNRTPYGTDKNISGTDDDPVYQTQQVGIEKYRLDVPPGNYELVLHFAELSGAVADDLAYNLSTTTKADPKTKRIFNVYVNDSVMLENFNIAEQYGIAKPVDKKIMLQVKDNGLEIRFKAITGEPVLNALQLKKIE
ncbi:MAG: glycoside hydrolase family 2 TIM barrel-domain containing protein [Ferruginibacter sp.]